MNLKEKLLKVQTEFKCQKTKYNSFGNFNYRSCEDILEKLKPLLEKNGLLLTISDDIFVVNENIYVKATATISDLEADETITATAFAREENERPKMAGGQLTGCASSYARKYALNGLILIDDTKDYDTDEFANLTQKNESKLYCECCGVEIKTEKAINYYNSHPNVAILCYSCSQKSKKEVV